MYPNITQVLGVRMWGALGAIILPTTPPLGSAPLKVEDQSQRIMLQPSDLPEITLEGIPHTPREALEKSGPCCLQ